MATMPGGLLVDRTLALALDPYGWIGRQCERHGTDAFQARLLLQPTVCLRGAEAARLFYDEDRFVRAGAAPGRVRRTLFGRGGVQGLDGRAHRLRKALFLEHMTPASVAELVRFAAMAWEERLTGWQRAQRVVLYREAAQVLCRAACRWAGLPVTDAQADARAADFIAMIEAAGAVGPRHWRGRAARRRVERWVARLVQEVRQGTVAVPEGCALDACASHPGADGALLDARVAAVELINFVRPTVAVAVLVTHVALALHEHPGCRERIAAGDGQYRGWFVHEVRRFYPFFPFVAARVARDFEWRGWQFPRGRRVLLDLHGTGHDARLWHEPETFRPERFAHWDGDPYTYVPQGGGDHERQHRCPGEWLTLELAEQAAELLARRLRYAVPAQRLGLRRRPLPAVPASGFVMSEVQVRRNKRLRLPPATRGARRVADAPRAAAPS